MSAIVLWKEGKWERCSIPTSQRKKYSLIPEAKKPAEGTHAFSLRKGPGEERICDKEKDITLTVFKLGYRRKKDFRKKGELVGDVKKGKKRHLEQGEMLVVRKGGSYVLNLVCKKKGEGGVCAPPGGGCLEEEGRFILTSLGGGHNLICPS